MKNHNWKDIEMPKRFKKLPKSEAGYPVPWFVGYVDGKPDFRAIGAGKIRQAHEQGLCWLCGETLGKYKAFVIGPMCGVNRVSSEPPSHTECAEYAAQVCPFLVDPERKRRETNLPEGISEPAGNPIARNPGVTLIWITTSYEPFRAGNGVLFRLGDPYGVMWFREGRLATRKEVMASIDGGLPVLVEAAQEDGPLAVRELNHLLDECLKLVPAV